MKRLVLVSFFLSVAPFVFSQGESTSLKGTPFRERIVTGGGMGLGFSNVQDYISVSPVVGYMLTTKLIGGVNLTYRFSNFKAINPSVKLHDYGVGPFVRYTIFRNIFLQAEYEHLNYQFVGAGRETARYSFNSFLAGGGLYQPISERAGFFIMALYNFSYKETSPNEPSAYNSPLVIRAGLNIGNFSF